MNPPKSKNKKVLIWATVCFVIFIALLSFLILISDKLINRKPFLSKIQSGASQAVNGKVELKRLELSFFPQPNIAIHQVRFSIPEKAHGVLETLTLYPKILPLFTGKFIASGIDLKTPDIKIQLFEKQAPKEKQQKPLALEVAKENIGAVLNMISSKAPGLDIFVENGRLNILKGDNTGFEVKDIHARIDLAKKAANFNIQCKPDQWEKIFLKGSLHLGKDTSSLTLAQLKLDPSGLNLFGKLQINHLPAPFSPAVGLELKSNDLNVLAARKVALNLAGNIPVVQDIFNIIKQGRVAFIAFTSHGNALQDLGKLDNINIQGRMLDGNIFVPKVNLDLTRVKGDVTISKGILHGNNLEARLQNSQGRQGTLKLGFEGKDAPFYLDVIIDADLAQLPSVLTSLADNKPFLKELALLKDLKGKATGRLILGERLSAIETQVEVTHFNLSTDYRRLPYLLNIKGKQFSYKKDRIALKNASGNMGQSSFSETSLQLDFKGTPYLEVKAGQSTLLMDEIYPWLSSYALLQEKLKDFQAAKGVLSLAALQLQGPPLTPEKWHFQMTGDLALQQGLNISTDIAVNPNELIIKKLIIKDSDSNASLNLDYKNRAFNILFNGNLNKTTIDNFMKENKILKGWIKGDFQTHVLLDQPLNSTMQGDLKVKDLIVLSRKNPPLVVNNLAVEAKENNLLIESANLSLEESRIDLNGNANSSTNGLIFDMDLTADVLNIDNLKKMLAENKKRTRDKADQRVKAKPVQGHIKLKTDKLIYQGLTWSPFYGDIAVNNDTATVSVVEANVCGITTPGNLKISPRKISLDIKPIARDKRLYSTIHCLLDKTVKVEGNFDFAGNIAAQGADKDLLGAINGDFRFTAHKGRLYSGQFHGALVSIVRLLSITEIFRGRLPDIGRQGFGYNSIKAKADIKNGNIRLNEMIIDGTSMNIVVRGRIDLTSKQANCVALVSPLKTIDAIFKKIPLVKDVLGGSLVSIPFSIKGHLEDLKVTPISTSKVDSESLEIIQRNFRMPVQIIQPNLSEEQKK